VGLLRSMSFVRGADAYEVFGGGGDGDGLVFRRFTDELREKRVPADEPGLARSARTVSRVEEALNDGQVRLVFPVQSEAGPLRLVTLDGGDLSPERRVLLMGALDIDHFKRVNDTYGHLMGDEVLLRFAQNMQQHFRYTDFLFRFGGEEFIVLLTNTNAQGARQAFERFRSVISNFDFPSVGRVTVSIGYTRIEPGNLPTTLVDWSDRALYHAKEHGRDQVVAYDDIRQAGDIGAGSDVELF
jgi:diguanylate cyclase (GGDEF)-like protein